jgi:hypothetical protein
MQEQAKPSSETMSPRRQREDYTAQRANKTQKDQLQGGGRPSSRAESGILRELAEEQRHLD